MKKLIFILHFSFLVFHFSFAQQYGWVNISGNLPDFPYDTTIINNGQDTILANFHGLCFISDNEGWMSTYHPYNDSAAILHTTDGGDSWEVQMVEYPVAAVEMLSSSVGYAAAYDGSVYRTATGGDTWDYHGSTFALSLSDMDFPPGSDTGYVCGQNGAIFRITPGGVEPMVSGIISDMQAIHFISPDHGWVCGQSVVKEYKNGEWVAGHDYPSGIWHDIFFTDTLHGWGVGFWLTPYDSIIIVQTEDDSLWMPNLTDMGDMALYSIFFLDNMRGWVAAASGEIFSTVNGGENWSQEAEGMADDFLVRIQFTTPTNGYICGNELKILKYTQVSGIPETGGPGDMERDVVEVFPNPTRGVISLQSLVSIRQSAVNSKRSTVIELVDLCGKPIAITPLHRQGEGPGVGAGILEFDISRCPSGIYFLQIHFEDQMIVKKIIKL